MKTVFLRALEADDKAAAVLAAIHGASGASGLQRFEVDPNSFKALPGAPFAYWASERLRAVFRAFLPFATGENVVKQGLASGDDFRFMRLWWEVSPVRIGIHNTWVTVSKGGDSRPFYADLPLVIGYSRAEQVGIQQAGRFGRGATHYYLPGLTYPLRASRFCPQALPANAITTVRGSGIYAFPSPAPFLALLNASIVDYLLKLMLGRSEHPQFDMGDIAQIPIPPIPPEYHSELTNIATRAWTIRQSLDTQNEISHAFSKPALLQVAGDTLAARSVAWTERVRAVEAELTEIQNQIDKICFKLYKIDEADQLVITDASTARVSDAESSDDASDTYDAADDVGYESVSADDTASLAAEFVAWAVGVAFGRFDVRLGTGAKLLPREPEPFDPLPISSPAMLAGNDGLPFAKAPPDYPIDFPENGTLVDDPGHPRDLTMSVRAVFDVVFGEGADAYWNEAAELLDPKDGDLRAWFSSIFFGQHLKRYSKRQRKAPVLWQLGTPSGRYSVWLYAHRLTPDSFFQLQDDVVGHKLAHEERRLTELVESAGGSPSAQGRKAIAAQQSFVEELRALLDDVKRLAPLWHHILDDGVVLAMAPLWRLVPHHKPWQNELKRKWDELCAGRYDWARLSMLLRPEHVVPKCATDRSLAIVHDLEDVFWAEDDDGKWKPRPAPTRSVEELVRERTSPAVKAALQSLLDSSGATAGRERGQRRRAAANDAGGR